jgi:hypothetical protein
MYDPQTNHAPVTLVPRHLSQPRKFPWSTLIAYVVGTFGLVLAGVTLALLLLWRSSVAVELGQLRSGLTTAQSQATNAATAASEVTRRLDGMSHDVNAVQGLISAYTSVCSTDLTGPNGPAMFLFPCQQKG